MLQLKWQQYLNQLGELWAIPVDDRQATNDKADDFVEQLLQQEINKAVIKELEIIPYKPNFLPEYIENRISQLQDNKEQLK